MVYPTKYGPVGNSVAPITSPRIFNKIVHFGPSQIAQSMVGTKAKLIFTIGVLIDKNLDRIISNANKIAVKIIFLFVRIIEIPFSPYF